MKEVFFAGRFTEAGDVCAERTERQVSNPLLEVVRVLPNIDTAPVECHRAGIVIHKGTTQTYNFSICLPHTGHSELQVIGLHGDHTVRAREVDSDSTLDREHVCSTEEPTPKAMTGVA